MFMPLLLRSGTSPLSYRGTSTMMLMVSKKLSDAGGTLRSRSKPKPLNFKSVFICMPWETKSVCICE